MNNYIGKISGKELLKNMNKEIEIPEGYKARIEGNKVIIERKESEDERVRAYIVLVVKDWWRKIAVVTDDGKWPTEEEMLAYLEKQKEKNTLSTEETELNSIAFLEQLGYTCVPPGAEQKPACWSEEDETNWQNYIKQLELQYWKEPNVVLWDDINWLKSVHDKFKSLRPQPHWKPSEEQMMALNTIACTGELSYEGQEAQLISLKNDLKKL